MHAPEITDPVSAGLPHRPPFVFVDAIEEIELGTRALCVKTFRKEEPLFEGHFPGNAIVPGVLLVEGMAQTAGLAIGSPGKMYLLTAIRSMKFLRAVRPGEPICFEAWKVGDAGGLVQCAVETRVRNELFAEGQIVLSEFRQC